MNDKNARRALLESMGIDPFRFEREHDPRDRRSLEERFGHPPGPPEPGTMWMHSSVLEGILVHLREAGVEANEWLATMDLRAHRADLPVRAFEARWGWTRSRVRRFVQAFDGDRPAPRSPRRGLVYAISTEAPDGPVKLGFTTGTGAERLSALQTGSPVLLVLLREVPAEPSAERALHRELRAHRLHGEWFERTAALAAIDRLRDDT